MNRNRMLFFLCSAALVLSLLSGTLLGAVGDGQPTDENSLYKHLAVFTEVLSLVRQAYVDAPDLDALMAGALDGTTDALDPFSLYVPPEEVERYERARRVGLRYSGLTLLKERGVAYVVAVDAGSPAADADIRPGDLVSKIDGASTRVMPLWEVEEALAGDPGTELELELLRRGETVGTSLVLSSFDRPAASLEEVDGVPVLRIPAFLPETPARVADLMETAVGEGWDRMVVDLRDVAGGEAEAAYGVAHHFASGGLGALWSKGNELESFRNAGEPSWRGTVVVLVTRGTLGAAEVLADILRESADAELVGERTFGWAGRQDFAELPSGGRLYFTEAFYSGPGGEPLSEGLDPDVRVNRASLADRDRPLNDLILDRGVERARELAGSEERAAA